MILPLAAESCPPCLSLLQMSWEPENPETVVRDQFQVCEINREA